MTRTLVTGRLVPAAVSAIVLAASLAACSNGSDTASPSETPSGDSTTSAPASTSASPSPSPSASAPKPTASPTKPAPTPTVIEAPEETPAPSGTVTEEPSAHPSPSQSASPKASSGEAAAVGRACQTNDLNVSVETSQGAAGSTYYTLTFTNTGSDPCSLSGYPAVSFVDGSGGTVGAAATQASDLTGAQKTLQHGETSSAALRSTQPDLYGEQCRRANASGLRVQAPGSNDELTVNFPLGACSNPEVQQLSVSAVGVKQ